MSPLRWTTKLIGKLLRALGYSLQGNAKQVEGRQHPDRDGQFSHINALAGRYLKTGDPVISIDAKNKELVGTLAGIE